MFVFQTGPLLLNTGYVHPACQPWLGLSREAPPPEGCAGQHSVHWQASLVSAFTGCAGQPACSSCFILSAAENQITWNTVLMVSHRGPGPAKLHPALSPHPPSGVKCPTQDIQMGHPPGDTLLLTLPLPHRPRSIGDREPWQPWGKGLQGSAGRGDKHLHCCWQPLKHRTDWISKHWITVIFN